MRERRAKIERRENEGLNLERRENEGLKIERRENKWLKIERRENRGTLCHGSLSNIVSNVSCKNKINVVNR